MIDVASVAAIDVHVHTERTRAGHDPMPAELREAAARYFGSDHPLPTIDDVAAYYRERGLAAVVFTVDWESRSGIPPIPNEETAARRGRSRCGQGLARSSSRTAPSDQSTCGDGCSAYSDLGSSPWCIASIILMTPATPAAAWVCPKFDLTEPSQTGSSGSRSRP